MTASPHAREILQVAAAAADAKGGQDLVALDVSGPLPLTDAFLLVSGRVERNVIVLQGEPPSSFSPPDGCHFHPRCRWQKTLCRSTYPELELVDQSGHFAACHVVHERGQNQ